MEKTARKPRGATPEIFAAYWFFTDRVWPSRQRRKPMARRRPRPKQLLHGPTYGNQRFSPLTQITPSRV